MKYHLITALFCLTATQITYAQDTYLPITVDGRETVELGTVCDGGGGNVHLLQGDTLLNGQTYKILYLKRCSSSEPLITGFLRSNETNSKLWHYDGEMERLIMDLDLEVGDRYVYIYSEISEQELEVIAIEEIDGRRTLTLDWFVGGCLFGPENGPLTFTEGVGPNNGLSGFLDFFILHCSKDDSGAFYQNPFTTLERDCSEIECLDIETSTSDPLGTDQEFFTIQTISADYLQLFCHQQLDIRVLNLQGQEVAKHNFGPGHQQLQLSHLPAGPYIVIAHKRGHQFQSKKFIKPG